MIMISKIIPFILITSFACKENEMKSMYFDNLKEQNKKTDKQYDKKIINDKLQSQIYINYAFSDLYPTSTKITSKGIYLGNGKNIFMFTFTGELVKKINLPTSVESFLDFAVLDNNTTPVFYVNRNGNLVCFTEEGKILFKTTAGDLLKTDDQGNVYSNYQIYDEEKDKVMNRIKITDKKGTTSDYQSSMDLGCLNFELIDGYIMLHTPDGQFSMLPLNTSKGIQSNTLSEMDGRVWFLGATDSFFIFRTYDYTAQKDRIFFYDKKLKLCENRLLPFHPDEIVKEQRKNEDLLSENPTATFYTYYKGRIFYLRNTTKGSVITELLPLASKVEEK